MFSNQIPQTLPSSANDYYFIHTSRQYHGYDFICSSILNSDGKYCSSFFVIPYYGACFSSWDELQKFIDNVSRETSVEEVQHD